MAKRTKVVWLLLPIALLALALSACSSSSGGKSGGIVKLKIGLCSDPTCLVPLAAVEEGFMKKHGVDASYTLFTNSSDSMNAALAGDVDVAGTQTDIQMLGARAKGASLQSFVLVGHTAKQVALIGKADIKSAKDLVGRRVGVPFGTAPQLFESLYLDHYGIDPKSVKITNLAPPDQVSSFARGDVDAFFGVQPNLTTALGVVSGSHIVAYSGDNDIYVPYLTMTAHTPWLKAHEEVAANVIRALRDAVTWIKDNNDKALALAERVYHLKPEVAKVILGVEIYEVGPPTDAAPFWSKDAEFLHRVSIAGFPQISDPKAIMKGMFYTAAYDRSQK